MNSAPVLLGDYAETWIDERRTATGDRIRPGTRQLYRRTLRLHLAPIAGKPLAEITRHDVAAILARLDDRPAARASTYRLLAAVCSSAVDDELIDRSPCRIRGATASPTQHEVIVPTPAQVEALAQAMPPRYQALLHLAAWDGLRLGEALALRRGDVDVDDDTITVRRTLTIVESRLRTGPPKSAAGLRTVHSPAHVAAILAAHMARWTGPHPDDPVFTNTRGDPLRAGPLYKAFWRARAQVDLPELHWHDLRHAAATYAAQTGASLAELQARIGHSTAAAALRYQHAATGRDQILAHNLEQLHTTRSARQASDAS